MMGFAKSTRAAFAVALAIWSVPSPAWDGVKTGKITGIDVVSDAGNFGFRVYMDGTPMCGTSEVWAFANKNVTNYDALVATVTSAYLAGKNITVLSNKAGIYCEIGYVQLR